MGTSLSGLTPATTFDGLLKVGDNDPLTATLKPISTGDGTDTILDLSTTAFKVSGETIVEGATTGEFFKVRNASNPTQEFYIEKVDDALNRFNAGTDTTYITYRDGAHLRFVVGGTTHAQLANTGDLSIGLGGSNASARMHIKGSGATSATTSLLVQNSAGTNIFKVVDDNTMFYHTHRFRSAGGYLYIEGEGNVDRSLRVGQNFTASSYDGHIFKTYDGTAYSEAMRITGANDQFVGIGETTPTARLHVKGSGNTNTTTSLLVQNSDGLDAFKIDDSRAIDATSTAFRVRKASNNSQALFVGETYTASAQKTIINSLQGPSAIFQVVGSGATSATTALLVQNSAGSDKFKVRDDGIIFFGRPDAYMIGGNAFGGNWYFSGDSIFRGVLRNDSGSVKVNDDLNVGGNANNDTGVRLQVKGSGNDATTTALLVQNSDGTDLFKVFDTGATRINTETLSSTIIGKNGTGGGFIVDAGRVNNIRADINGVAINSTTTANTSLSIKGQGATSATTALLVQNSAGTDLLKVEDGGNIRLGGNMYASQYIFNKTASATWIQFVPSTHQIELTANTNKMVVVKSNGVGINTDSADASAVLQADSTTQGFLPPRMTTTQRDAITTPAAGLMIYNTTTNKAQCYNGTIWSDLF